MVGYLLHSMETHNFVEFNKHLLLDVKRNLVYTTNEIEERILEFCKEGKSTDDIIIEMTRYYQIDEVNKALLSLKDKKLLIAFGEEPPPAAFQHFTNSYTLTLNVTHSCNLRCRYCYLDKEPFTSESAMMTKDTARKAVDFMLNDFEELERLGISFYGGEPLLNSPVIKTTMLYAIHQAKLRGLPDVEFHITTNGTLLNDEIIGFIKRYKINVLVSLDGPSIIHDSMRVFPDGSGSHSIVIDNLRKLFSAGGNYEISASAVVTRRNRMKAAFDYVSLFDFKDIKISYVRYLENCNFGLTRVDREHYIRDMKYVAQDCVEKLSNGTRPPYYNFETKILQLWKGLRRNYFCPAGIRRFGVSPSGDIYPCGPAAAMGKCWLGHVKNGLDHRRVMSFVRSIAIENKNDCSKCWARYLCAGGCCLPLVRNFDEDCKFNKTATRLAIYIFAMIREKNELLLSCLVNPQFLLKFRRIKKDAQA